MVLIFIDLLVLDKWRKKPQQGAERWISNSLKELLYKWLGTSRIVVPTRVASTRVLPFNLWYQPQSYSCTKQELSEKLEENHISRALLTRNRRIPYPEEFGNMAHVALCQTLLEVVSLLRNKEHEWTIVQYLLLFRGYHNYWVRYSDRSCSWLLIKVI